MNEVLPLLSHDQVTLDEIRSALNAGKEVTTHTGAVSIPGGWAGFGYGYVITDPVTGEGVYKISGGLNGGVLMFLGALMLVVGLFLALSTALFIAGPLLIGGVAEMIIGGFAFITGGGEYDLEIFHLARILATVFLATSFFAEGAVVLPLLVMLAMLAWVVR